ncbi:SIMPL domain-containing protein [Paludibacterium paludis]|uniref:Secreted protein n=1 Tax=Paludibacterium paludis TaxID=1225769 RepID=A0A918P4D2_9NEIS|nr:SIMPL domain-containing protein [Paludibacterium paludis]GGY21508.1 hypothetical protein GCM10011289_26370 [Paludibacterium paludis]
MLQKKIALPCLILALGAGAAQAGDTTTDLRLTASAQSQIANDQLSATLYLQEKNAQPAQLADRLNRAINRALADAKPFTKVETTSGSYNTWPDYDKNGRIQGWQGRAEIRLKSRDIKQASELVAKLQQNLALGNLQFEVSDEARRAVEKTLIPAAIGELKEQGRIAAQALGKSAVQVKELEIGNNLSPVRPVMLRMKAMGAAAEAMDVAQPNWQPGQSEIQLQVTGRLELK